MSVHALVTAFTTYWKQDVWQDRLDREGEPVRHAASNEFRERGVRSGDRIYVTGMSEDGEMMLITRIDVERVCDQAAAELAMGGPVYEARDHVIGPQGTTMLASFERIVPEEVTRSLTFEREDGTLTHLTFRSSTEYLLDPQTLRTVRRLTDASAAALDQLL